MANQRFLCFCVFSCIILVKVNKLFTGAEEHERKEYIVYMGALPKGHYIASSHHLSMLEEIVPQSTLANCLITSFHRSFNGFAANLTDQEARRLASRKGVVSVFPSTTLQLQTTRSWDFLGYSEDFSKNPSLASDIVIGVIDSGIWPSSESFNDQGFGSPPNKWKGFCQKPDTFCNKKIVGARHYVSDSALDVEGHGTHTASTAAGNVVRDASFSGLAKGSARGGLPSSRIAVYKVCSPSTGCNSRLVLTAFDDAIGEGVDIITISIGSTSVVPYQNDTIAIGAFHAMEHGILTIQSAGNDGPRIGSTTSLAPWHLGVAASTTNRRIVTKVVLGNGKTLVGSLVNTFSLDGKDFPLVHGKDASGCDGDSARECDEGCLDVKLVRGKIVLCENIKGIQEAKRAGAIGCITPTQTPEVSFDVPLPAVSLSPNDFDVVKSYVNSTDSAKGKILESEAINDSSAPYVASFSSRGPNTLVPDILKPDISAPGVQILAAFSPIATIPIGGDKKANYTILSGTSMACPHVAGVAAFIKASHPNWSPSAIMSAIITTASPMNATLHPEGELAYGSGNINPVGAVDPGLVYEATKDDYVKFLCSIGFNRDKLKNMDRNLTQCPAGSEKGLARDLNYPSMAARLSSRTEPFSVTFQRTVTNVGYAPSIYYGYVSTRSRLKYVVTPDTLSFSSLNEKKAFNVTVSGDGLSAAIVESSILEWYDGYDGGYSVSSHIVLFFSPD